jgi:hypothetical protein
MNQSVLTEMADLLNSNGINYSVFLKVYSDDVIGASEVGDIINKLLNQGVVVSRVCDVEVSEVIAELQQCLGYVGSKSDGPGVETLRSGQFSFMLNRILEDVRQLNETSYGLKSLVFAKGHPAYPVFWDFAFLFLRADKHVLLVGSSSD